VTRRRRPSLEELTTEAKRETAEIARSVGLDYGLCTVCDMEHPLGDRLCPFHGDVIKGCCPNCVADFPSRRDPDDMTGEERVQELRRYFQVRISGIPPIPLPLYYLRISELVDLEVHAFSFARRPPEEWLDLARSWVHVPFDDFLALIPRDKDRIVVSFEDEKGRSKLILWRLPESLAKNKRKKPSKPSQRKA